MSIGDPWTIGTMSAAGVFFAIGVWMIARGVRRPWKKDGKRP